MEGLFSSNATTRDAVRRRVLGLTAATAVAAVAAVGGLLVGLVPAHAGQPTAQRSDAPADSDDAPPAPGPQQQAPVATSGGS